MSALALPDIEDLLQPISPSSESGEDLDPYLDPYESLSYRFSGEQTDYKSCVQDAEAVLKEQSKHLQVVAWLTLSWLMVEGIRGYRKGLSLMKETLSRYGATVFPVKKKHRVNAFRFLARDKWVQVLCKKIEGETAGDKAAIVEDIMNLLVEVADLFVEKLGEVGKPDISGLLDKIGEADTTSTKRDNAKADQASSRIEENTLKEQEAPLHSSTNESSSTRSVESNQESTRAMEEAANVQNGTPTNEEDADSWDSEEGKEDGALSPEIPLPEEVDDLLQDVSFSSRTGKDIEEEPDEEDNLIYDNLKSEMRSFGNNDYNKCVQLCFDILQNRSKHLRVVVLLCISWYRTEGLSGLGKGFLLLQLLLKKYQADVYPVDTKKRIKIIQRLNSEDRLQMLGETLIGNEKPRFSITDAGIKSLSDIPKPIERSLHKLKGQSFVGEDDFWKQVMGVIGDKANDSQKKALIHHFTTERAGQDRITYSIDEQVLDSLKEVGLNEDVSASLSRLMGVTYKGWNRCYEALLTELGDEHVALYEPVLKGFMNQNVAELLHLERIFERLQETCSEVLQPDPPRLDTLSDTVKGLADSARTIIDQATADLQDIKDQKNREEAAEKRARERTARQATRERPSKDKKQTPVSEPQSSGGAISSLEIKWAEDAEKLLKKALIFYVDDGHKEGDEELKAPLDAKFYGMSRTFKWGNISIEPPDGALKGPEEITQNYYKNPPGNIGANQLIRKYELAFLKQNEFLYWIDGQKVVLEALDKLGEQAALAAHEIKMHLGRLLERCPTLPSLYFQGKKTTFASPETREWLKDEIIGKLGGGGAEKILPPVIGEDYEAINVAYEEACAALPDKFEEHAVMMRQAVEKEERQRGKFLIRLNLANYYSLGNHHEIARANFNGLIRDLEQFTVSNWEPALCVAMWRSAFVNNSKLLENDLSEAEIAEIEKQQRMLFELIARYDGVLAHKLKEYIRD